MNNNRERLDRRYKKAKEIEIKNYRAACFEYFELAKEGYDNAQFEVGWQYLFGDIELFDKPILTINCEGYGDPDAYQSKINERVIYYFGLAAAQEHIEAQYRLALAYKSRPNEKGNLQKSIEWLKAAVLNGHAWACDELGYAYEAGQGVTQNFLEAERLYLLAFERNNNAGRKNLIRIYTNGFFGVVRSDEAAKLRFLGAKLGDAEDQFELGKCYLEGLGVSQDKIKAYAWLSISENLTGSGEAASLLAQARASLELEEVFEAQGMVEKYFGRPVRSPVQMQQISSVRFFKKVLKAPLSTPSSWGAITQDGNVYLRVWADQVFNNRVVVRVPSSSNSKSVHERDQHIEMIRRGAIGKMVVGYRSGGVNRIARYEDKWVLVGDKLETDEHGVISLSWTKRENLVRSDRVDL
jgi:TPR repeat protein